MNLVDRAATSRALSQELGPFARQHVNAQTAPRHLSTIENLRSMFAEQRSRHHTPVTTIDELWHRAEAAWEPVAVRAIHYLCDLTPVNIKGVITARNGCFGY
ncbi:hypothetical protein TNCV_986371 [Trichonephila clavipes]|uniref:Uncharacterized protein n=1 Tax=Trichonephila clavipes TaxID=2585209 RepID=A0A8X6VNX5_TRICX|nr:hypothetical protein TNCV_986371 [Trichonephila clavipes]